MRLPPRFPLSGPVASRALTRRPSLMASRDSTEHETPPIKKKLRGFRSSDALQSLEARAFEVFNHFPFHCPNSFGLWHLSEVSTGSGVLPRGCSPSSHSQRFHTPERKSPECATFNFRDIIPHVPCQEQHNYLYSPRQHGTTSEGYWEYSHH